VTTMGDRPDPVLLVVNFAVVPSLAWLLAAICSWFCRWRPSSCCICNMNLELEFGAGED
jgi:hypothetical protein